MEVRADAARANARSPFSGTWVKIAICVCVAVPVLSALLGQIDDMDGEQVAASIRSISVEAILAAALLTAVSFFAMARYDDVAMRSLGITMPRRSTLTGGFVATSLSQALGLGLLVGSIARWRCYRDHGMSFAQAGLVSGVVISGFTFGFLVVLTFAAMIDPSGLATLTGLSEARIVTLAWIGVGCVAVLFVASFVQIGVNLGKLRLAAPRWRLLRANIGLAAADTLPAAAALWVLIPAEDAPTFMAIVPIYLMALGLGLVSNTPGGIGVLELTCLMALPVTPPEHLVAALIVFRGVFYGIPVLLGLAVLVAKEFPARDETPELRAPRRTLPVVAPGSVPEPVARLLSRSARAEAELAATGDKEFLLSSCGGACLMFAQSGNSLVAISDPIGDRDAWPELVEKFEIEARTRFAAPFFYKPACEFAQFLAAKGHSITHIAVEAELRLEEFSLTGSKRRELRRKLRIAEKAGLEIEIVNPGRFDAAAFAGIAAEWQGDRPQKGFSMGRFDADYLRRYPVVLARLHNVPVAFVSLWHSGDGSEISIDVMRLGNAAPDGTMHALCMAAVEYARVEGAATLSLCAVPLAGITKPATLAEAAIKWVYEAKPKWHQSQGLHRFKNAFRPDWSPRYACAPSIFDAVLGAGDTARLINRDTPDQDLQSGGIAMSDAQVATA